MGEPITDEDCKYIKSKKEKYALIGLEDLEGLNTLVYEEGENSINKATRELIQNYQFEIIQIDESLNEKVNYVDMFIRLNQNPCPISPNSFEMWNSLDVVKTIRKVKEIAKYSLFKQNGNKMVEEEIVTTMAYMNHNGTNIENMTNFFSVYIRTENKDKINEHQEIKNLNKEQKCYN